MYKYQHGCNNRHRRFNPLVAAFGNGTEHHSDSRDVSAVGFEPTSANTVELESTPLDRSGTLTIKGPQMPQLTNKSRQLNLRLYVP